MLEAQEIDDWRNISLSPVTRTEDASTSVSSVASLTTDRGDTVSAVTYTPTDVNDLVVVAPAALKHKFKIV